MITVSLSFTYDRTTPESAERGDHAEHGFYGPGGNYYPIGGCELAESDRYELSDCPEPSHVRASEAVREVKDTLGCLDSIEAYGGQLSACESDGRVDYSTGAETRLACHIKGHPRLIAAIAKALNTRR